MRSLPIAALLAALALAGCADGTRDAAGNATEPTATATPGADGPGFETHLGSGMVIASAGEPSVASFTFPGGGASFPVPDDATLLHVELRWDSPAFDLDLALHQPGDADTTFAYHNSGGSPGAPDSPHSLTIPNPKAGDWQATAFGKGGAANVAFEVAATVFTGARDVPAGFTGFPA